MKVVDQKGEDRTTKTLDVVKETSIDKNYTSEIRSKWG